ncbi:hypothetical protein [Paraburkholderia acidipaludis]|uniref:hypothetical protein n=1 Tax=Paraburkholderia acidipaludis TaxID=660537 RepID=UPI0012EC3E50|nr:hypothetical protein [Paraburkholderia acidipaludis]
MSSLPENKCRTRGPCFGDKRAARKKPIPATTKTETARRPPSPYTVHNLDTAIAHLETAMCADQTMEIFGPGYWRGRVLELQSTPGILDTQERRLRSLMERFAVTG